MRKWFVTEQVEEEDSATRIIDTLKLIGDERHALLNVGQGAGQLGAWAGEPGGMRNKEAEKMSTERKLVLSTSTALSVNSAEGCDNCGEDLGPNPVLRGEKVYCCAACAFEAKRSVDCGGRADSHIHACFFSDYVA